MPESRAGSCVAQGMTTDRAFVLGTGTLFREWGYVAMSRGRHENRFYAVVGEPTERDEIAPRQPRRPPLEEIEAALNRSRAQRLASVDAVAPEAMTPRRARNEGWDRQRSTWFRHAAMTLDPPEHTLKRFGAHPERPDDIERWRRRLSEQAVSRERL